VQLAGETRDELISRHHCHLEMHAPLIWVRDLGSKNGTFINGTAVRVAACGVREAVPCTDPACPEAILSSGDILTIGGTSLRVEVVDCPSPVAVNDRDLPVWKPGEFAKKSCPVAC
jgi:serine/threonine-protein kinase